MDLVLKVPVRRFVLQYIRSKFQLAPGQPWRLSKTYKEDRYLQALLERTPNRYEKYQGNEAILDIEVPSRVVALKGCYLTQDSIDEFNDYIYKSLIEEITAYDRMIKGGIGLKDCSIVKVIKRNKTKDTTCAIPPVEGVKCFGQKEIILGILNKYDIGEDDLAYDTVKKAYQRATTNKKTSVYQ